LARPPVNPECGDIPRRVYHNVYQFDVKMMYPSFVLRFKIDPTVYVEGTQPPTFYDKVPDVDTVYSYLESMSRGGDKTRVVYHVVRMMVRVRSETKRFKKADPRFEHLDNAVKAVLNALAFGVMGKRGWGILSNDAVAESIFHGTRAAQYELFYKAATSNILKKYGCKPIYSDTDSIFISCQKRLSEDELGEVQSELNRILERWGLMLDFEGYWRMMYIHGKKNYILVGDDDIMVKGSYFHRLAEYELPPVASRILHEVLLGRRRLEEIVFLVDREPLDEISIDMHNMLSRVVLKTEKERSSPKHVCIVRTPWQEVPWGRLLRLHKTGFYHPRRACLLAEALRMGYEGTVTIDLRYYDALQIIEARGYPGWGESSTIAARLCGGDGVVLVEGGRVYCAKVDEVRYVLEDLTTREIPSAHSGCDGRPLLTQIKLYGFRYRAVDETEYRRLVKKHIYSVVSKLLPR